MTDLDLSIIIPLYNAEYYITDCLSSLENQNIDPERYEIIVVNDGSKDNSLKVAKDFADNNPNVRIIEQENQGVGAARNTGIEHARGAYIYLIDADDYLAQNTLDKVLKNALQRDLDVLCFKSTSTKLRNLLSSKNADTYQIDGQICSGTDFIANYPIISTVWWFIVKKDFLLKNKLRFINGIFMEDVIYSLQLLVAAEKISSTNLDVHRYYENRLSIIHCKEVAHYNQVIKDMKSAVIIMEEVINKLSKNNGDMERCIEKIRERQHYFIYLLLARLIKTPITFQVFKNYINNLQTCGLYPIIYFPGKTEVSLFNKIAIYIFNRLFLLLPFTYTIKRLHIGKYLRR